MSSKKSNGDEGVGPRFKRGADDLDQLTSIERGQRRSRKARKSATDVADKGDTAEKSPLIERIEKSRRRVQNRLGRIKDLGEANEQFGA